MKFTLREFARKIREHLKTAKHTPELTKQLEKLAADAYAVSNMPGWDDQEIARKGLKSLATITSKSGTCSWPKCRTPARMPRTWPWQECGSFEASANRDES